MNSNDNINELKKAYSDLTESEHKFKLLAENINDVFFILSENNDILYINSAFETIFGRKIEEIIKNPENIIDWIYDADKRRINDVFKSRKYKGKYINEQFRIIKPDGTIRWLWSRNYPVFNEKGKIYRIVGIISDITEQKYLENALQQSGKKLFLHQQITPLAYIEWNIKFEIISWNPSAEKIFGYKENDAIGSNLLDLIIPSYNRKLCINLLDDLLNQRGGAQTSMENIAIDGKIKTCEWYNTLLKDKEEEIIGLASIIHDVTERIEAEKEVINSENFYNTTVNSINDIVHVIDRNYTIVIANEALRKINKELGLYTKVIGLHIKDVYPFLKPKVFREYEKVFNTGEEINTEDIDIINKKKHYTETRKTPVFEDGKVVRIITTVRDISIRKKAEEALLESEKRLQLAMDAANDGLWELNPKTMKINYYSPRYFTMLGYFPDELPHTYKTWLNLIHPDDRNIVEKKLMDYINEKCEFYVIEFRMKTKKGEYKWILSRGDIVEYDIDRNPTRMIGTHVDITERVMAEKKKEEYHKNQQFLSKAALNLLIINNSEDIYQYAGNKIKELINESIIFIQTYDIDNNKISAKYYFGNKKKLKKFEKLIGNNFTNLSYNLPYDKREKLSKPKLHRIYGGFYDLAFEEIPCEIAKKIEQILENKYIYIMGLTRNNELFGSVAILTKEELSADICNVLEAIINQGSVALHRKYLEEELLRAKEKAEGADKLKTSFLTNMSHEIRTPMNGILGFAELLKDPELPLNKRLEFVNIISSNGEHLLRLINDIIDISKIEAEQIKIVEINTSINLLFDELHEFFTKELESKNKQNISLIYKNGLKDEESYIFTDPTRLRQIMFNLLGNAVKYTYKGEIEFGYSVKDNNYLYFYIKDTGIGLTYKKQKSIFERFTQADASSTRKYGGTGLGLAITKGLVEIMGGEIGVESESEKGSIFYFTIPYKKVEKVVKFRDVKQDFKEKFNWTGKTILIVEDDFISQKYLQVVLEKTNVNMLIAKTGKQAVELCKENPDIDLILMDIQLPEMSGYEAIKKIKSFRNDLPIIAQTADAMPGTEKICLKTGCSDYISKPINKNILKPMINLYLSGNF